MMSDRIRILTDGGIENFRTYLQALRDGSTDPAPIALLTDPATSRAAESEGYAEQRKFSSRYEFGSHLEKVLSRFDQHLLSRNHALWNWLALYYFDQTCPVFGDGRREPGQDARHILPTVYDWRSYYRHLAREAWLAVRINGETVKPLLAGDLSSRGDLIEQCTSRQTIISNPVIMGAICRLYVDPETGRPRRGTGGKAGGSPRRLSLVLQQLDMTFDLRASTTGQVVSLLPDEFERWRKSAKAL
jgi:hypothetical protein